MDRRYPQGLNENSTPKMKILIDARFYGLENTGIGRYTIGLVKSLAKIDRKNDYHLLLRKKYFNRLNLPSNWNKILAEIPHYSFNEQRLLPKIIKEVSPDLTHFLHFNVPVTLRGKFVVTIHDLLMHRQKGLEATTLSPIKYFVKRLGYKSVFAFAVKKSRVIIVPSAVVKNELVSYYKIGQDKVVVAHEGVDTLPTAGDRKRILEKFGIDSPYFIYAGNAYPHKNLKRAVEAIVKLNKGRKEPVLFAVACARNAFTEKLEKLVDETGATKYIRLLGFVPDNELGVLYKNSLGFLFPSLSEGFGLPGLEAILAGTLTLCSNIPVFRETYQDVAIYFDPLSSSSIKKAMNEVALLASETRAGLIKKAQRLARRYSWDKMARQTLRVYEDSFSLRSNQ